MYEPAAAVWTGMLDIKVAQLMRDNTTGVLDQTEGRLRNADNRTNAHCGVILHIGRTPVLSFRSAWYVLEVRKHSTPHKRRMRLRLCPDRAPFSHATRRISVDTIAESACPTDTSDAHGARQLPPKADF